MGRDLWTEPILRALEREGLEQWLLQVGLANTAASSLYRSLGFVVYGTELRGLKIGESYHDEYLMMLELAGV